jgi:hypothetical protein
MFSRRPCHRPRPTAEIYISPQCTLPVSATNGHDVTFSWEEDFDWGYGAAAAAAPIWSQEAWEENEDAVVAADALAGYMERNNAAAAAANAEAPHRARWNGADWAEQEWEDQDLPLVYPNHAGLPQSVHSSMPGLETVPPTPSPSSPPLQLQYMPDGAAGPTYALQVGPSLHRQPVEERLTLLHQLRNVLITENEEEQILARRSSPPAAAAPVAVFAGCRHSSPAAVNVFTCRRHSIQ